MIYLDTSYLVKIYGDEPGAEDVLELLEGRNEIVCAGHGRLELVSAFKRHQREGRLTVAQLNGMMKQLGKDETAGLLTWLPVTPALIGAACELVAAAPVSLFVRAADALHLATARDAGLKEVHSHDRHLLAAAPYFGLKGIDVIK